MTLRMMRICHRPLCQKYRATLKNIFQSPVRPVMVLRRKERRYASTFSCRSANQVVPADIAPPSTYSDLTCLLAIVAGYWAEIMFGIDAFLAHSNTDHTFANDTLGIQHGLITIIAIGEQFNQLEADHVAFGT